MLVVVHGELFVSQPHFLCWECLKMTNDMKEHMFLLGILLAGILHPVHGTATTTLSVLKPGFLGQSYTITCDTTGIISSGIAFHRPDGISVVGCNLAGVCVPNSGYNTSVYGKQYKLHIYKVEKHDAGAWNCTDGDSVVKRYSVAILSPVDEMNCSISRLNASTLLFNLRPYYCSSSAQVRLLSRNGLSCDVKPSSNRQIVNGTCGMSQSGEVNPVMSCGDHTFNLTCHPALGTAGISGTELLTANKVCAGLVLVAVHLILNVR